MGKSGSTIPIGGMELVLTAQKENRTLVGRPECGDRVQALRS
jgi:hypothetical protein